MSISEIIVVRPIEMNEIPVSRIDEVLSFALSGLSYREVNSAKQLEDLLNRGFRPGEKKRILFAVSVGESGINLEYCRLIRFFREHEDVLSGFTAGVIVDGNSMLFTKSTAADLVFTANCAGCSFVGKPLVEGTKTLENFAVIAGNLNTDYLSAYKQSAAKLIRSLLNFTAPVFLKPELLVLHASSHEKSNTFALWQQVKKGLTAFSVTEIGLRNGTLSDCSGCPYKMCLHFGEKGSCFYGGVMVEDVYPAVKRADALLMLCPNYNDSLSANLTAFINRLTALFRTYPFDKKALYAIIVSGYSGSDIVAKQLICALNMNKAFYLPEKFAMLETANNAGTALKLSQIDERIDAFTDRLKKLVNKEAGEETEVKSGQCERI